MHRPHGTIRVDAGRDISRRSVALWLAIDTPDGKTFVADASSIEWREAPDDGWTAPPTLHIPERDAPAVAEALAREGYGPDRAARNEGELEATKSHRDDLRRILGLDGDVNAGSELRLTVKVDR